MKDSALAYSGWNFLKTPSEQLCWVVGVADSMVFVKEEPDIEEGAVWAEVVEILVSFPDLLESVFDY